MTQPAIIHGGSAEALAEGIHKLAGELQLFAMGLEEQYRDRFPDEPDTPATAKIDGLDVTVERSASADSAIGQLLVTTVAERPSVIDSRLGLPGASFKLATSTEVGYSQVTLSGRGAGGANLWVPRHFAPWGSTVFTYSAERPFAYTQERGYDSPRAVDSTVPHEAGLLAIRGAVSQNRALLRRVAPMGPSARTRVNARTSARR